MTGPKVSQIGRDWAVSRPDPRAAGFRGVPAARVDFRNSGAAVHSAATGSGAWGGILPLSLRARQIPAGRPVLVGIMGGAALPRLFVYLSSKGFGPTSPGLRVGGFLGGGAI